MQNCNQMMLHRRKHSKRCKKGRIKSEIYNNYRSIIYKTTNGCEDFYVLKNEIEFCRKWNEQILTMCKMIKQKFKKKYENAFEKRIPMGRLQSVSYAWHHVNVRVHKFLLSFVCVVLSVWPLMIIYPCYFFRFI